MSELFKAVDLEANYRDFCRGLMLGSTPDRHQYGFWTHEGTLTSLVPWSVYNFDL